MGIQLVWFKRDLRINDHVPLVEAAKRGPCLGLYVYEPELIEAEDSDAAHLNFVNQSLSGKTNGMPTQSPTLIN